MIVEDQYRKCVAFVALRRADVRYELKGSGFWVGQDVPNEDRAQPVYFVTARHVIDGIRNTGVDDVYVRVNQTSGRAAWLRTQVDDWYSSATDRSMDVSIIARGINQGLDHLVVPYSAFLNAERFTDHGIGLGDEVFVTGLFRHHIGEQRNIPIVRVQGRSLG